MYIGTYLCTTVFLWYFVGLRETLKKISPRLWVVEKISPPGAYWRFYGIPKIFLSDKISVSNSPSRVQKPLSLWCTLCSNIPKCYLYVLHFCVSVSFVVHFLTDPVFHCRFWPGRSCHAKLQADWRATEFPPLPRMSFRAQLAGFCSSTELQFYCWILIK